MPGATGSTEAELAGCDRDAVGGDAVARDSGAYPFRQWAGVGSCSGSPPLTNATGRKRNGPLLLEGGSDGRGAAGLPRCNRRGRGNGVLRCCRLRARIPEEPNFNIKSFIINDLIIKKWESVPQLVPPFESDEPQKLLTGTLLRLESIVTLEQLSVAQSQFTARVRCGSRGAPDPDARRRACGRSKLDRA